LAGEFHNENIIYTSLKIAQLLMQKLGEEALLAFESVDFL